MPNSQSWDLITHERLASLIAAPAGEDPVVSLYFSTAPGAQQERRLALKNLAKQGEELARADTGFDEERRRKAVAAVERVHAAAEEVLRGVGTPKGTFVAFARDGALETLRLPVSIRDRIVVERTPYTSPLSSILDQYERYGVLMADQRRGRILEVYLGAIVEWETVDEEMIDKRRLPSGGGHDGLEDARRRHHGEYLVHRHLQHVADRAFAHFKKHGFEQVIVAGPHETLPRFIEHLHPYVTGKIVAREHWALDLPKHELLARSMKLEAGIEAGKEKRLFEEVHAHLKGDGLATQGYNETLKALTFGKVRTLIVEDGATPIRGRECPECHVIMPRPDDAKEHTPTLVPCPQCNRPTQAVPDVIDQAVELAIQSGSRVEHIAYEKEDLGMLGGIASILRFK